METMEPKWEVLGLFSADYGHSNDHPGFLTQMLHVWYIYEQTPRFAHTPSMLGFI